MNTISNIANYLNTQLNTFFTNFIKNPTSIQNLENFLPTLIHNTSITALEQCLQLMDDIFSQSDFRKQSYSIKGKRKRTLITALGVITYTRRYYRNKSTGAYYFYIDDVLELLPFKRCTKQVDAMILDTLARENTITYRQAAAPFGLSKGYVYQLLKQVDIHLSIPDLKQPIQCKYLYVQADEEHIHQQFKRTGKKQSNGTNKSTNYELKEVTIFTGRERIGNKRYRLLNKVIVTPFHQETNEDFYSRVNAFIQKNYTYDTLYCYGDGAWWIKKLAERIASTFILDKFHFKKSLTAISGNSRSPVHQLLQRFAHQGEKDEFEYLMNLHMGLENRISTYIMKTRNYLLNNWDAYQLNYQLSNQTGCSAEGINSHYFAAYFSSRPKGFCIQNIHTIGILRSLHFSNHSVKDFYMNHTKEINTHVHEYYTSYKYKNKIKTRRVIDINCEMPILDSCRSGTRTLMQKIRG